MITSRLTRPTMGRTSVRRPLNCRCIQLFFLLIAGIYLLPSFSYAQSPVHSTDEVISDPRIGIVQGVTVDDEGRIYVGDLQTVTVHRYLSDGTYDRSFGEQGQAPGQFESIAGIQIESDSLWVYDRDGYQLTVFPVDGYRSNIGTPNARVLDLPTSVGKLFPLQAGNMLGGLRGLWMYGDGTPTIAYGPYHSPNQTLEDDSLQIHRIETAATGEAPLLKLPSAPLLVFSMPGGGTRASRLPFGHEPIVRQGPSGNLYGASSGDLRMYEVTSSGETSVVVDEPTAPVPVTRDEIEAELSERGAEYALQNMDQVEDQVPETHPVIQSFCVASDGRIWVAVNTKEALESGNTEYWVFSPNGAKLKTVTVSGIVHLQTIGEDIAYGLKTEPSGLQKIVRLDFARISP